MSDTNNWKAHIEKRYAKEGYMDKYGGSVLITGITIAIFGMLFGYHHLMADVKALKKDWVNIRCNPLMMPLAGVINAPPDGSKWAYTAENFGHCVTELLKDAASVETAGLNATQGIMHKTVDGLAAAMQDARKLISSLRNIAGGMFSSILNKILNVLLPLRMVLIKSLDTMNKTAGVGVTSLFTALGGVLSMRSFIWLFLIMCIFTLIMAAMFIVAMLLVGFSDMVIPFFGWALAIPSFLLALAALIFLVAVLVVFIPVISIIIQVLDLTSRVPQHKRRLVAVQKKTNQSNSGEESFENRIPARHFCFDPSTVIHVKKRGKIKISNIKIGDKLMDGSTVTSVFQLANQYESMYEIKGIKVTGNHRIDDSNYGIIAVKDHPESKLIKDYWSPVLYSINTTSKRIPIKQFKFLDYDDMDDMDVSMLRHIMEQEKECKTVPGNLFIHKFLEAGLHEDATLELEDGRSVKISDIKLNSHLKFGQRILGIVKIDGRLVNSVEKYNINNTKLIGTKAIKILSKDLGVIPLYKSESRLATKPAVLYNIITDTGMFMLNDLQLLDYNGGLGTLWDTKFSYKSLTV